MRRQNGWSVVLAGRQTVDWLVEETMEVDGVVIGFSTSSSTFTDCQWKEKQLDAWVRKVRMEK